MSATYTVQSQMSWNYLGALYGIDPHILAHYNNCHNESLENALHTGRKVTIPSAQELVDFFERLPPADKLSPVTGGDPTISHNDLPTLGNPVVVVAARMRRLGHTGDNYNQSRPLRSANPNFYGNTAVPDQKAIPGSEGWWKCNILVAEALHAAGLDWKYYADTKRPVTPANMVAQTSGYAQRVWLRDDFRKEGYADQATPHNHITAEEAAKILPGDVMVLHEAGHSAIVTSTVQWLPGPDGKEKVPYVRILDIYGEHLEPLWDVGNKNTGLVAILRPNKKLPGGAPGVTVGGNPNNPPLDLNPIEVLPEKTGPLSANYLKELRLLSNGYLDEYFTINESGKEDGSRQRLSIDDSNGIINSDLYDKNEKVIYRQRGVFDKFNRYLSLEQFDANDKLTARATFHKNGQLANAKSYAPDGHMEKEDFFDETGMRLKGQYYDASGRKIKEELCEQGLLHETITLTYAPDGIANGTIYDCNNKLIGTMLYAANGQPKERIDFNASNQKEWHTLYDKEGKRKLIEHYDTQGKCLETIYVDAAGNQYTGFAGAVLDFFDWR